MVVVGRWFEETKGELDRDGFQLRTCSHFATTMSGVRIFRTWIVFFATYSHLGQPRQPQAVLTGAHRQTRIRAPKMGIRI